jgi:formylglycine-generating enzyme required for sulfatase activity
MSGNVHERCLEARDDAVPADGERVVIPTPGEGAAVRIVRGGAWNNGLRNGRLSLRHGVEVRERFGMVGFRLVCSVPSGSR